MAEGRHRESTLLGRQHSGVRQHHVACLALGGEQAPAGNERVAERQALQCANGNSISGNDLPDIAGTGLGLKNDLAIHGVKNQCGIREIEITVDRANGDIPGVSTNHIHQ